MLIERLKKCRIEKGITQKELAKILDISPVRYNHYENGNREPDYGTLKIIADYFNVSTDYLLGRTDTKKPYITKGGWVTAEELRETHTELAQVFDDEDLESIKFIKDHKLTIDDLKRYIEIAKIIGKEKTET